MALEINIEQTPNPNSLKFVVNTKVSASTQWFANAASATKNALAADIFTLSGVANVMLLNDFVTVGKDAGTEWSELVEDIKGKLSAHLDG